MMATAAVVGLLGRDAQGVEVISISHSIANQTGQRLDSDQEFVVQGL